MNTGGMLNTCKLDRKHPSGVSVADGLVMCKNMPLGGGQWLEMGLESKIM